MDGILLVDKPSGKTSHDVVDEVRRRLGQRSVGHSGTLDPLATGLLVLGVGKATRLLEYMQYDKTYEAEFVLGVRTDTDDAAGAPLGTGPVPTREELEAASARLVGELDQRPPRYSAVKVRGRRLYEYARRGKEVEAPERRVRVTELALLAYDPPRARFRIGGSKGLYIRSIARDLGGHVVGLRRTVCGPFRIEEVTGDLLPMDAAILHLPEVDLSALEYRDFDQGRAIPYRIQGLVRVYRERRFVGIGEGTGDALRARKVIRF